MIIIAGYSLVDADVRDERVAAFRDLVTRCREADGCIDVAFTADTVDPERVNMFEIWRDVDALDAWRKVANGPKVSPPKHMEIKRYDAEDGGPLF